MASLTKSSLKEALRQRGVSVPSGSPKKEVLVELYREHVLGRQSQDFGAGGNFHDFSSDEEAEKNLSTVQDSSYTLPDVVTDDVTSLSDDDLYEKLRSLGVNAGPIVGSTRRLYEKRLQHLLNNGHTPAAPADEFSATEEEEEDAIVPETDEEDGGTPLQDPPKSHFFSSTWNTSSSAATKNVPFIEETQRQEQRPLSFSSYSSFSRTTPPVQMSLRSRTGVRGADIPVNHMAGGGPPQGRPRGLSLLVKVLVVLAVLAVNVFIYANLEYFKSVPSVPSVLQDGN